MKIKRDLYLNRLIDHKHNGLIKIITGVRRCGKSYLLFNIFSEYLKSIGIENSHIIKVAIDDFNNRELRNPEELYNFIKSKIKGRKKHYILIDEVQLCENFESVLNGFLRMSNLDIYVTGSNSKFLSSDIITEFRGRGDEIRVYPLSFAEFSLARKGTFQKRWLEYITYGGMPLAITMKSEEEKARYLTGLFETTFFSDIINRHNLKGDNEIDELTDILASSIGSLTNPTKICNTFRSAKKITMSANTISSYIDYLLDSFLIEKAIRYDIKGRKYINTPVKYYFTDVGLRNARLGFRQVAQTHLMENVIYNELKLRGLFVDVGEVTTTSKNKNDNVVRKKLEVDFVVNIASRKYYIQSALSIEDERKLQQEQNALLQINDAFKKIIITREPVLTHYNEHGILIASLEDFLQMPESVLGY